MKPTSLKEYVVNSVFVRANWLSNELERLRAWEKASKCYSCGELVSRNKATQCAFCDNRSCHYKKCPMFNGFDDCDDAICDDCLKKRCAICYNILELTKCSITYCKLWVCDTCTKDVVCLCGTKSRMCSDKCFNESFDPIIPCSYIGCKNVTCTKCFDGDEYWCTEHEKI